MSNRTQVNLHKNKITYKVFKKINLLLVFCAASAGVSAQQPSAASTQTPPACFLSEFRHLALSTHEPTARTLATQNWLTKNVMSCSTEQLNLINANRSNWLGTSDSSYFAFLLDSMIEYKLASKPEMLAQIFGSLGKEGTASVQTIGVTPVARTQAQPAYDYQQQQYQQQYPQQQAYPQAHQQPAYPQAAYQQPNPVGR